MVEEEKRKAIVQIEEEALRLATDKKLLMEGLTMWTNPVNKFTVLDLEYKADPSKRSEAWKIAAFSGMPKSQLNREYGSTWTVYEGKPVYPDFDVEVHVMHGDIIVPKRSRLISGWDGGPNDLNIAWAVGITGRDGSIIVIDEFAADNGDLYSVVEEAQARLGLEWQKLGGFSLHIADQAIFTPTRIMKRERSMADVLREHGMSPIPGEQAFGKRRELLMKLMTSYFKAHDGGMVPKFRVHERCKLTIESLNGGYAYPKRHGGGDLYNPKPIKNKHSHIANAVEYMVSRINAAHTYIPYEGRRLPKMESTF